MIKIVAVNVVTCLFGVVLMLDSKVVSKVEVDASLVVEIASVVVIE